MTVMTVQRRRTACTGRRSKRRGPVFRKLCSGGGAEDFSAFSFTKASPLLGDWQQIPAANSQSGPLHSSVKYHTDTLEVTIEQVQVPLIVAGLDDEGTLTLNVGPHAALRGPGQMDGNEAVLTEHVAGAAGDETLLLKFQEVTETSFGVR
jgi:hypothetical protein